MKAIVHENRVTLMPESPLENATLIRWVKGCVQINYRASGALADIVASPHWPTGTFDPGDKAFQLEIDVVPVTASQRVYVRSWLSVIQAFTHSWKPKPELELTDIRFEVKEDLAVDEPFTTVQMTAARGKNPPRDEVRKIVRVPHSVMEIGNFSRYHQRLEWLLNDSKTFHIMNDFRADPIKIIEWPA